VAAEVVRLAQERYGLAADTLEQSAGFEANSKNFRVGDYVLKRLTGDAQALAEQLLVYQALRASGIPTPAIMRNTDGEWLTQDGAHLWLCMEYIDGRFFAGSPDEVEGVIALLPAIHAVLRTYPAALVQHIPSRPCLTAPYRDTKDLTCFGAPLATMLREAMPDIVTWSQAVVAALPSWTTETTLVHIDLHPRNLLSSHETLYVLDFDSLQWQSPVIAYNFAAYKLFRRCVGDGRDVTPSLARLFAALGLPCSGRAAQAEILFRLLSILEASSPGGVSIWRQVLPLHLRGLYEAMILLGDQPCT